MSEITQVAIAENKQAIWDYDPNDPQSLVNGGVDVIAVIRTLIVKVRLSFPGRFPYLGISSLFRYKPLANASRPSKSSRWTVRAPGPLLLSSTTTRVGAARSE